MDTLHRATHLTAGYEELSGSGLYTPHCLDVSTKRRLWRDRLRTGAIPSRILGLIGFVFYVGRLTAGRTPPTPLRSPPLLVLPAAFTQTPPTDSVRSCCHSTPAVVFPDYPPPRSPHFSLSHTLSSAATQGDACISLALTVLEHRTAER